MPVRSLVTIVPPKPVVTVDELAAHLQVDTDPTFPALAAMLIGAAQSAIDGPDGTLGRSLGEQQIELRGCGFPAGWASGCGWASDWLPTDGCGIMLPCGPVLSVDSITYVDATGAQQTLDPSLYVVVDDRIEIAPGGYWPVVRFGTAAVRVRYTAGYRDTIASSSTTDGVTTTVPSQSTVPANARYAVLLMAQRLHGLGSQSVGIQSENVPGVGETRYSLPDGVAALLTSAAADLLSPLQRVPA